MRSLTSTERLRRIVRDLGLMVLAFLVIAVLTGVFIDSPGEHSTTTRADAAVGAIIVGSKLLLPYLLALSILRSLLVRRQSTVASSIGFGFLLGAVAGIAAGLVVGTSPSTFVARLAVMSAVVGALHGALAYLDQGGTSPQVPDAGADHHSGRA